MNVHEVGDIFVAVVEVVGEYTGGGKEDQWACGDGLRGVPDVGLIGGVVGATELLDAEEVFVKETLKRFCASLHRAHGDAAAKAVVDVDTGGIIANTSICEISHGKR